MLEHDVPKELSHVALNSCIYASMVTKMQKLQTY